jgi:alpha-amylase
MKKTYRWISLSILTVLLVACQEGSSVLSSSSLGSSSEDWKVIYDVQPTSPDFLTDVSSCYQIFPYAFADSNDDGIGDLNGITENLDYLNETLGVDCIWLTPIHPSPSYHKYDVTDFYRIDPVFGTMAHYQNLLTQAEAKGIRVLMDLVINHTSSQHPWFINASIGPAASYHDFYRWLTPTQLASYPNKASWYLKNGLYYFASFWSEMPELNYENPLVREEIKKIVDFWLDQGVDGFRIDAAKHIYDVAEYLPGTTTYQENINYFREFNHFVKENNPDAFVVGEVYTLGASFTSKFYQGMDSAFNFDFADKIIQALQSNSASGLVNNYLNAQTLYANERTHPIDSIFLTNHDQDRLADQAGFEMNKLKLAIQVTSTVPGITWIYYGEELGMGGSKPDNNIRQPFKWSVEDTQYQTQSGTSLGAWGTYNLNLNGVLEQKNDPSSLLNHYQHWLNVRGSNPILSQGVMLPFTSPRNDVMMYRLQLDQETVLVLHNFSNSLITLNHEINEASLIEGEGLNENTIELSPYGSMVLSIESNITSLTL